MNENILVPIEQEGQRVLLTSQLAESYETTSEIISNNFNRNKTRYEAGKHYFVLEGNALREFKANHQFDEQLKFSTKLYLWTERGALLHAKSLNTDRAWEVYDRLVETYFRATVCLKGNLRNSPNMENLNGLASIMRAVDIPLAAQKSAPETRARQAQLLMDTYGLPRVPDYVKIDPWQSEQLRLEAAPPLITIESNRITIGVPGKQVDLTERNTCK